MTHVHQIGRQLFTGLVVGDDPEVGARLDFGFLDALLQEHNVPQDIPPGLIVGQGDVALSVQIDHQDLLLAQRKVMRQVNDSCGFAYPTFLIGYGDDFLPRGAGAPRGT